MTNMINCSRKKHKKICKMCYAFIKVIISRKQDNPIISIHTQFRSLFVRGFPRGSLGKESAWNLGDLGLIPGLGRSPGEGNGYPLQYSCLENSMDRGAWQATAHRVAKSPTLLKWLSTVSRSVSPALCHPMDCSPPTSLRSNPHLLNLLHWQADPLPLAPLGKPNEIQ